MKSCQLQCFYYYYHYYFISLSCGSVSSYPPSLASVLLFFHPHSPHTECICLRLIPYSSCSPSIITFFPAFSKIKLLPLSLLNETFFLYSQEFLSYCRFTEVLEWFWVYTFPLWIISFHVRFNVLSSRTSKIMQSVKNAAAMAGFPVHDAAESLSDCPAGPLWSAHRLSFWTLTCTWVREPTVKPGSCWPDAWWWWDVKPPLAASLSRNWN